MISIKMIHNTFNTNLSYWMYFLFFRIAVKLQASRAKKQKRLQLPWFWHWLRTKTIRRFKLWIMVYKKTDMMKSQIKNIKHDDWFNITNITVTNMCWSKEKTKFKSGLYLILLDYYRNLIILRTFQILYDLCLDLI